MLKKTILYSNPDRDIGLAAAGQVKSILEERKIPYVICTDVDELYSAAAGAGMVITFGGDGTILHCARAVAGHRVPVLGVNLGNKGFIAELEKHEIDKIALALDGEYTLESRMMLDVSVWRLDECVYSNFALNDVVIGGIARVIDISVFGDGRPIMSFSGDGLIASTPTGSTAYSMAAGGPIVEPDAENIIITPICPHVLWARSYVLTPKRVVTVDMGRLGDKTAYLSADGSKSIPLLKGDIIEIKKSALTTKLVRITDRSFYEKVSEKLGEK
ncbi:MAG: NAD(+)/NADH kinase [Oscillospiraceae bacterium]